MRAAVMVVMPMPSPKKKITFLGDEDEPPDEPPQAGKMAATAIAIKPRKSCCFMCFLKMLVFKIRKKPKLKYSLLQIRVTFLMCARCFKK